jgi:hypothetical protein
MHDCRAIKILADAPWRQTPVMLAQQDENAGWKTIANTLF